MINQYIQMWPLIKQNIQTLKNKIINIFDVQLYNDSIE